MAASTDGTSNKRLSVLIVGPDIRGVSGEPTHIRTLLNSPLKHEFDLSYHRVGGGERRVIDEHPVKRHLIRWFSPGLFVFKLLVKRPDIVHINNTFNLKGLLRDCWLAAVARTLGAKVVFEMHGGEPGAWIEKHPVMGRVVLMVLRRVHAIVYLSSEQGRFLHRNLPEDKAVHIPNMVKPEDFKVSRPHNPPAFLFMGRLLKTKGVIELVQAFAGVPGSSLLWIAGDGPARPELQRLIQQKGLENRVKLLGFVVGKEKTELLGRAWALVLPSHHEGFPYAILEAMASGLPIIATEVGGVPEMVQRQREALLVPPGQIIALQQAMIQLLEPGLRDRMAKASLRWVQRFSVNRVSQQYARLYRSLFPGP